MSAYSGSRRGSPSPGSTGGDPRHQGPAPGKQTLTSQLPPVPAQAGGSEPSRYTVRTGDTLGSIARRLLGDAGRWQEIADANGITDPRALQIGAVLTIPSAGGSGPAAPDPSADGEAGAPGAGGGGGGGGEEGTSADDEAAPSEQVIHTVARGETLGALAQRYLGDSSKWRLIAEANGIDDPKSLQIGQPLTIPGAAPGAQPTGPTGEPSGGPTGEGGPATPAPAPAPTGTGSGTPGTTPGTTSGTPGTTPGTDGQQPDAVPDVTPGTGTGDPEAESPQPAPEPAPAPAADGVHVITDPRAFLRSAPPALASTGESIPAGTRVRVVETAAKEGRSYVKVEQVLQDGDPGPAQELGWTSKANLSGFEGGGHDKEHDESLRPEDAILLTGLNELERRMAIIYNAKAKYLHEQAQALGISTAAAAAVLKVESGGGGFANDGRMIIRFENHVFYDRWGRNNKATFDKHFKYDSDKRWQGHKFREGETGEFVSAHQSQSQEWQILQFARGLSNDPALESISMGAAQIMGFNYATEGYATVQAMFDEMSGAIKPQLVGMFTFIENTSLCINGLKEGDYVKFAKGYNGAGQAAHYGALIEAAAAAWTKVTEGKTYGG